MNPEAAAGMEVELRNLICRFDICGKIDKNLGFFWGGGNDYQSDHVTSIEKFVLWD